MFTRQFILSLEAFLFVYIIYVERGRERESNLCLNECVCRCVALQADTHWKELRFPGEVSPFLYLAGEGRPHGWSAARETNMTQYK